MVEKRFANRNVARSIELVQRTTHFIYCNEYKTKINKRNERLLMNNVIGMANGILLKFQNNESVNVK